jgi:hypothetical protein
MNTLVKNSICPCGHEKIIKWIEPLRFCMGYEDSCYGVSVCSICNLEQTHYSGSLEGAIELERQIKLHKLQSSSNDDKFN